jgi:hypothetical protein
MTKKADWKKVGVIGVDAGLCWIGDPCYTFLLPHSKASSVEWLTKPKEPPKEMGDTWIDFCDIYYKKIRETEKKDEPMAVQFNYDLGHPGLGVCCQTGYGDGTYNVYVKEIEGRVAEMKVVFIGDEEEEGDDNV